MVVERVKVFYDRFEQAGTLGKDLYTLLYEIYLSKSRYCVMLISNAYVEKMWTSHERVAAQERALMDRGTEYIIPVRLDNTHVLGLSGNIAYVSITEGISNIANLLIRKLWMMDMAQPKGHIDGWIFDVLKRK